LIHPETPLKKPASKFAEISFIDESIFGVKEKP
jgi:hypothetical protein